MILYLVSQKLGDFQRVPRPLRAAAPPRMADIPIFAVFLKEAGCRVELRRIIKTTEIK